MNTPKRGIPNRDGYPPPRDISPEELARIMNEYGCTEPQARVIHAFGG